MRRSLTKTMMVVSVAFLVVILALAAFGLSNLLVIGPITTQLNAQTITEIEQAGQFHIALARTVAETQSFALSGDADSLEQAHAALSTGRGVLAKLEGSSADAAETRDQAIHQEYQVLNQSRANLLSLAEDLTDAVETAAEIDRQASADKLEQIESQLEQLDATTRQLIERDKAAAAAASNVAIQRGIYSVGIAFSLIVVLIGLAIFLLRWRIVAPLKVLAAANRIFSTNNFDQAVQVTSNDEIGELQVGFNQTVVAMREQTHRLEREVLTANTARREAEQAQTQIAEQLAQIDAQHLVIREMSVPVLPLTPTTLVMPLVGALDTDRLSMLQERVMRAIEHSLIRYVLLDVTGILVVDTQVAQGLIRVIQAARLLGTEVVLVGIRPEIAQSIIGLGIELGDVVTRSTLQSGIAYASGINSDKKSLVV